MDCMVPPAKDAHRSVNSINEILGYRSA